MVVIAPGRAHRPGAARGRIEPVTDQELEQCPFCEGREDRTPPEVLALPERRPPDSPGWRVRVVPNLYPAFERQEVVVHAPQHVRAFADLPDPQIALIAEAWQRRRAAEPAGYLHALVNEGWEAGASLAHSHSQLVWFREPPPAVVAEHPSVDALFTDDKLSIADRNTVSAAVHPAGRAPYELVIAPDIGEDHPFNGEVLADALLLLRDIVAKLRVIEGALPWNAWLHVGETWHIEVLPRLAIFAGIELGAGLYVNTLAPEDAAKRLRNASAEAT